MNRVSPSERLAQMAEELRNGGEVEGPTSELVRLGARKQGPRTPPFKRSVPALDGPDAAKLVLREISKTQVPV